MALKNILYYSIALIDFVNVNLEKLQILLEFRNGKGISNLRRITTRGATTRKFAALLEAPVWHPTKSLTATLYEYFPTVFKLKEAMLLYEIDFVIGSPAGTMKK